MKEFKYKYDSEDLKEIKRTLKQLDRKRNILINALGKEQSRVCIFFKKRKFKEYTPEMDKYLMIIDGILMDAGH